MARDVCFMSRCSDTRLGCHVRIVGSCGALGDWLPESGLAMQTSAAEFPIWTASSLVKIHEDDVIEYKYVICDSYGRPERWEERPNRRMHLASLAARGICTSLGCVFVEEGFNINNEPDEERFPSTRSTRETLVRRASEAELGLTDVDVYPTGESDLIAPTTRERSTSLSTVPERCKPWRIPPSSYSESVLHSRVLGSPLHGGLDDDTGLAPEALSPASNSSKPGEATPHCLAREESSSNLFSSNLFIAPGEGDKAAGDDCASSEFEDRYVLVGNGPLGEGTFGLVWRCAPKVCSPKDSGRGSEERAAKIVRKARLQPRDMKNLLGEDGEVRTHITMKHANIVTLFEYFDEPLTVTLVLECCRGGDLFDAIARQSRQTGQGVSELASAVATRDVLSALAYMHQQRVVHRDIKCENVLLQQVGVPLHQNVFKLCDLGFAAPDYGAGLTDRLGSPDNVAPEVVMGKPYSTPVDLWSLGVIVYMMISATPPFYAPTDREVLRKVRSGAYSFAGPLWVSVSQSVKSLIASLMMLDPSLRPNALQASKSEFLSICE